MPSTSQQAQPQDIYANDIQPLEDLFEQLCTDLRTTTLEGVQLEDGTKFYCCPVASSI